MILINNYFDYYPPHWALPPLQAALVKEANIKDITELIRTFFILYLNIIIYILKKFF